MSACSCANGRPDVEQALEHAAEHMSLIDQVGEAWRSLPPDVKQDIQRRARLMWEMRGAYLRRFLIVLDGLFAQNPAGWQQALQQNRAAATQQMAQLAGQMAQLPRRGQTPPPGMSPTQVRQYHRRQQVRGYVPGRSRQTGRSRELELELEEASRQLEAPEPFFTKVTPIPGIGNKEGHEILTRVAMRGFPLSGADRSSIELGVIRPDRGGRSYWNFPRSALESLKARAQPAHALRPTPSSTMAAALHAIRLRFAGLHRRAMRAPTRSAALEWIGEALHLLQDSFSRAHVDRGPSGRIARIRAFFIRFGRPWRSRAPDEHDTPSDRRDDVHDSAGRLTGDAWAAIRASKAFLTMALRHRRAPAAPGNRAELAAFIGRYLSP